MDSQATKNMSDLESKITGSQPLMPLPEFCVVEAVDLNFRHFRQRLACNRNTIFQSGKFFLKGLPDAIFSSYNSPYPNIMCFNLTGGLYNG